MKIIINSARSDPPAAAEQKISSQENLQMKKIGLALTGGGAKGAYQIGVWKALEELGIFSQTGAVSGTSVGALNAVLMAVGDFENAKKIWESIDKEDLFSPNKSGTQGICSREGLLSQIKRVPISRLHSSIPVFVNLYDKDGRSTISVQINQLTEDEIIEHLLASSAMPFIYDSVKIHGREYIDAGVTSPGNVPIEILYEKGYRNIIVSALDNRFSIHDVFSGLDERYPGTDFTVLQPLDTIGKLVSGTLDISRTATITRMVYGYIDTRKIITKENLCFMKKGYTAINVAIKSKMQDLFHSGEELETFVNTASFKNHNTPLPVTDFITMTGYTKIVELYGWTLQQGKINQDHYRLIDNEGRRRAWVLDPEEFMKKLEEYEAALKFL